jgi:hypothetical protein
MADEREEERPKIVDNRLLSDNERKGFGPVLIGGTNESADASEESQESQESEAAPRLEIIGGGAPASDTSESAAPFAESEILAEDEGADDGGEGVMDEAALREQIEGAITAQMEAATQQLGRPLTGKEREQVRAQVEAQIEAQLRAQAQAGAAMVGEDGQEMSPEEQAAMREQMEQEQFAAIEAQVGRALTDQEKDQVRAQMEEQAQAAISLEVAPVLLDLMVKLPNYAAVHLGLSPNPYTQLVARNDANARLSIDALGGLFDIIKPLLDNQSRREFERVINDLRVNYTRVTGQPIGPAGGPSLITGPRLIR